MNHRERVRRRTGGDQGAGTRAGASGYDQSDVDVRIGELAIHDLPPGHAHRLGDSVQRELEQLFAERGVSHQVCMSRSQDRIGAQVPEWPAHAPTERRGAAIALAVYEVLTQAGSVDAWPLTSARSNEPRTT